jgi:transcriptional regulator with XRE-family HTH domain
MIGKSEQYIGRIERGTHVLTGDVVKSISDATGVSADYIIHGVKDPLAMVASLYGVSNGQIQIVLDIVAGIAKFINTEDGNSVLMKEALRRSQQRVAPARV